MTHPAFFPAPVCSRLLTPTIVAVHAVALTATILIVVKPTPASVPQLRSLGQVLPPIHQAQLQLEKIQ
jgi:hypothetical protein